MFGCTILLQIQKEKRTKILLNSIRKKTLSHQCYFSSNENSRSQKRVREKHNNAIANTIVIHVAFSRSWARFDSTVKINTSTHRKCDKMCKLTMK